MEHGNTAYSFAMWMLRKGFLRIDDHGYIWRCAANRGGKWVSITPRRAENKGNKGYLRVTIQVNGRLRSIQAHRLVWCWAYKRRLPDGVQINHLDLDKSNNLLSNLEPCSGAENIAHSYQNGRMKPWSKAEEWRPGIPRISSATVSQILKERGKGKFLKDLAREFNLSITHVHRICQQGGKRERG